MSDEHYSRAGRVMFLLVWIIIFAGLFLFFYYHGKSESTVYLSTHNEYIVTADNEGHYQIKGRINEYPVEFLVDTGATSVAVPQNLADKLHLKGRYPITITTANGDVTGSLTRIEQLSFGEFTFQDVKAVIIPASKDGKVLLGMNILAKFNIMQEGKRLVFKRQASE